MVSLLFVFRLVFLAILFIFTSLLFSSFNPGGRYHVLIIATLGAFCLQIIRLIINGRIPFRERGLASSLGILLTFGVARLLLKGVNFSFTGILFSYLGVLLMEMLLPDEMGGIVFSKKD